MPNIVFASPKGGAGKSTSAVLLATELVSHGAVVTLIDADPNNPLSRWAKLSGFVNDEPKKPLSPWRGIKALQNLTVIAGVTEDSVIDVMEEAETRSTFVIVDLEGTASMTVGFAISRAELVIIPTQGSQLDAVESVKALRLIRQQERAFSKTIPFAVLFTRTSPALNPRTLKSIADEFGEQSIPMMTTEIHERDAYKAIFAFGGGLAELDGKQVRNIDAARANVRAYAAEVIHLLKAQRSQKAGQAA